MYFLLRRALCFFAVIAACGGTHSADLFPGGGSPGGDASADTSASESKDGEADNRKDAATEFDASATDGAPGDGGIDAGYADPGIFCGIDGTGKRTYCNSDSEICCADLSSSSASCEPHSSTTCDGVRMPCSDERDCSSGKVCCAVFNHVASTYISVDCKSSCSIDNELVTEYRMCDPKDPVDRCAAVGKVCKPSVAVPGWYVCTQ